MLIHLQIRLIQALFFTSYCPKYQTDSPRAATNFEVTGLCAANAAPHSALLERQEPPA
jgi:hypothetical protein